MYEYVLDKYPFKGCRAARIVRPCSCGVIRMKGAFAVLHAFFHFKAASQMMFTLRNYSKIDSACKIKISNIPANSNLHSFKKLHPHNQGPRTDFYMKTPRVENLVALFH
jgi:hypothetical protein